MVGRVFNYNSYYSVLMCANCGHRDAAQVIKPCDRRAACWFGERIAGPGDYPPYPGGGGKTGGVFLGRVGYISQPFKTSSSEQGVQEKQGGMNFEQVCKK